jgi:transcriptional regulator
MYSPTYAVQTNQKENEEIIRKYPFATVIYSENNLPQSFHLPLILQESSLIGHMAKANPSWKALHGTYALFIFHGPHHYISPTYYGSDGNVPTWNYVSVQVRGMVKIIDDQAFLKRTLLGLAAQEDSNFDIEKNIQDHQNLLEGIVGIEVEIKDIFGKFKLAQSKSEEERKNVIIALEELKTDRASETAAAMKKTIRSDR